MNIKSLKMILSSALFLALFGPVDIYADYIEGIDTTDANGYGMDSSFKAIGASFSGKFVAKYKMAPGINCFLAGGGELFPYYFDEIKIAVDSLDSSKCYDAVNFYYSYVLKKADNTYLKLKFLQTLPDHRNVYQFGLNNVPNDRVLEKTVYNRSILYKPNNLRISPVMFSVLHSGVPNPWGFGRIGTDFNWDPPLPNNNHLLGYILYSSKPNNVIDTSAPINLTQWDSSSLIITTYFRDTTLYSPTYSCFNLVAVYQEGKSDFLKGLGYEIPTVNIAHIPPNGKVPIQKRLTIKTGVIVTIQYRYTIWDKNPVLITIYSVMGEKIADFTIPQNGTVSWAPSHAQVCKGLYIVKAEFSDHTVLTQPFLFTK